jgi:hypothetical protein
MSKYNNLKKLYSEIELLESAGLIKAANVLHKKFVKEAQQSYPKTREDKAPILNPGFDTSMQIRDYVLEYAKDIKRLGTKAPIPKTTFNLKEQDFINKVKQGQIDPDKFDDNNVSDYAFILSNQANTPSVSKTTNQGVAYFDPEAMMTKGQLFAQGLGKAEQDNNQIVDANYLFTVIKSLAEQFEDYIQDAILGRDTNISLTAAKYKIDEVEKYLGPKYSQNIKDYAQAQLDIMRKRFADMYQKYYVKDNVEQSSTNPSKQEEKEKRLYMNALNDIILAFKEPNKETGEAIFQKTVNQFQNPKRKQLFINQIDRQRRKYFPQGPFLPEMSNEEGQQLTDLVNQNVAKQNTTQPNATKPNVATSTDTNNQLYQIVSNFYRSRDVTVTSPEQMYADLKADPARKTVVRNHIRTSRNPNTNQLVALFDSKTK